MQLARFLTAIKSCSLRLRSCKWCHGFSSVSAHAYSGMWPEFQLEEECFDSYRQPLNLGALARMCHKKKKPAGGQCFRVIKTPNSFKQTPSSKRKKKTVCSERISDYKMTFRFSFLIKYTKPIRLAMTATRYASHLNGCIVKCVQDFTRVVHVSRIIRTSQHTLSYKTWSFRGDMIQWNVLGPRAAPSDLKVISPRNVVYFKSLDAARGPRTFYWTPYPLP